MRFQKQIINVLVILFLLYFVHAQEKVESKGIAINPSSLIGKYDKNDLDESYNESTEIQCTGTKCVSLSNDVLLDEGKVTISKAGTFILSGELNGQLNIATTKEDLIHLILRNATISSNFGPAIYGEKCKKLIITIEGQNTISDSTNYPEEASNLETKEKLETEKNSPNACIFIKSNLTFNGNGSLDVNANFNEGIRSKKNLKLVSGKINVISKGNAIKAKESISIKDVEINIDSGKSAIKVTKDTDPEEGFIVVDGGKITIKAVKDGIHAETRLSINDGIIKIIECEEGLEGEKIDITGGDIYIDSNDDCINASKIKVEGEEDLISGIEKNSINDEQVYIRITGGRIDARVEGIDPDAIDSNGSLYIGGTSEVYADTVYGGVFGRTASLDSDGTKVIDVGSIALITASGKFPDPPESWNEYPEESDKAKISRRSESLENSETSEMSESIEDSEISEISEIQEYSEISEIPESIDNSETFKISESLEDSETPTVEDILKMFPYLTEEQAVEVVNNLEIYTSQGVVFSGSTYNYDEPNTKSCLQPYIRVIVDLQSEGTPIVIKDKEGKALIERKPRARFAIIFFTSPEIIEGETYLVNVGSDITKSVVATIDTEVV